MTHTLHRVGKKENLRDDFIVFTMSAKQVNAKGSAAMMCEFFQILEKHKPINFGDMKTGNTFNSKRETILDNIQDTSIVHFVYKDKEIVGKVLEELKDAELGISVVVSGLIETTERVCKNIGLKMHTVEFSGGIHGKLELLPEEPILEVTTMCGHGMVASNLVEEMVKQIKKGKKTPQGAAIELAKPCQCGIFNPERAENLIRELMLRKT